MRPTDSVFVKREQKSERNRGRRLHKRSVSERRETWKKERGEQEIAIDEGLVLDLVLLSGIGGVADMLPTLPLSLT